MGRDSRQCRAAEHNVLGGIFLLLAATFNLRLQIRDGYAYWMPVGRNRSMGPTMKEIIVNMCIVKSTEPREAGTQDPC